MKKLLTIIFTVLLVTTGCTKDDISTEARSKFIGRWAGNQTAKVFRDNIFVAENTDLWEFDIEEGSTIEEVIVDDYFKASVMENCFFGDSQKVLMMIDGKNVEFTAHVSGEYTKNNRLILSIEMHAIDSDYEGLTISFKGTNDPLN